MDENSKTAKVSINSFDYATEKFRQKDFKVKTGNHTTVLDALIDIKEFQDHTVSFRYSCRMGICGSCAMVINGKPVLACETPLHMEKNDVKVEPMKGHPILKDLVTDFDDFFEKHKSVTPWIARHDMKEKFDNKKEYKQTDMQRDVYLPFAECIKCGLCLDACPVVNTNKNFIGPQALAQAHRYNTDSKDEGKRKRLEYLDSLDGAWGCEFSGSCSVVCPKHVDPALAIQLLKAEITKYRVTGKV